MQHIETDLPLLAIPVGIDAAEYSGSGRAVNAYQGALEIQIDVVFLNSNFQCWHIVGQVDQNTGEPI